MQRSGRLTTTALGRRAALRCGQRKVHLKIKKAAKSVQGDIDAAKKRLDDFRKRKKLEEERRKLRSAQERQRMRKEFIRRQNNRRAARRKAKEEKKYGVKTTQQLYGRMEKDSLHEGDFDARQAKSLQSHIHYPEEYKRAREEQDRWLNESMEYFKNWIYPLRKVFMNYSRDFMPQRINTIDFEELQKLRSGLTISDWMIFVNDFELMPWQVTKTQALAIFHYSNLKLGGGDSGLGARRGAQIITFEEYISCLRGVAMGEGFRSLRSHTHPESGGLPA